MYQEIFKHFVISVQFIPQYGFPLISGTITEVESKESLSLQLTLKFLLFRKRNSRDEFLFIEQSICQVKCIHVLW